MTAKGNARRAWQQRRASVREHAASIARSLAGRQLGFTAREEAGAGIAFALCGAAMVAMYLGWFA